MGKGCGTMGTIPASGKGEERILLHDVNWEAYEALLRTWAERPIA